jgi:ribonuclease HIII
MPASTITHIAILTTLNVYNNAISIKIPASFSIEIDKAILNLKQKCEGLEIAKIALENKQTNKSKTKND